LDPVKPLTMISDVEKNQQPAVPGSHVFLHIHPKLGPLFHDLFQGGVRVKARIGATIHSFLCEGLGLDPRYVEERIQTVFLNGKAVDDPTSAVIPDHAVIALSAAMPGVLGATLRKGGYYAAMRGEISHSGQDTLSPHEGKILLKLFNLLPGEIGASLLSKGVWVKGDTLKKFFETRLPRLKERHVRAEKDDKDVGLEQLAQQEWPADQEVFLKVRFE
jgi:hypothetical protein